MSLSNYLTLGRSGLRVSPLCLGTMTFGTEWGWGSEEEAAAQLLDRYVESGGNFLDTADGYTNGKSEEICGRLIRDRGLRDRIVLATKFTFNVQPGNPTRAATDAKTPFALWRLPYDAFKRITSISTGCTSGTVPRRLKK